MISSINSIVSKVVSTVSGPLHTWGPNAVKLPKKPVAAARAVKRAVKSARSAKCSAKCRKSARCRNKKCKCS